MTTAEMLARFRELADDNAASNNLWSDATLLAYLNEAQTEACRRARLLEDRDTAAVCTIAVVAATTTYAVDPRVMFIRRVKLDSVESPLVKVRPQDLDTHEPGWEAAAAVTEHLWWQPWPSQKIRIEKPAANTTMRLWVVRDPLVRVRLSATAAAVASITRTGDVATATLTTANPDLVDGDSVTIAGAGQAEYNGAKTITVVSPAVVTFPVSGAPATPATGTITYAVAQVSPEIPARYHFKLVDWMLYRALLQRDKEEKYDPQSAADHLSLFEAEFGQRSSAIDETWIQRQHGYDEHEGVY